MVSNLRDRLCRFTDELSPHQSVVYKFMAGSRTGAFTIRQSWFAPRRQPEFHEPGRNELTTGCEDFCLANGVPGIL
jgi:hypothetical protein